MWDWGRKKSEVREAMIKARVGGDEAEAARLEAEFKKLDAEHPYAPDSWSSGKSSLNYRIKRIEEHLGLDSDSDSK